MKIISIFLSVKLCNASLLLLLATIAFTPLACVHRQEGRPDEAAQQPAHAPGDSTLYALVAAGTTDSILVYLTLPYNGADPDTVSILEAMMQHRVYGWPEVGDNVAIMRCDSDTTAARSILVTEKLCQQWCYKAYPSLRRKLNDGPLPPQLQQMLDEPREYSMVVKSGGVVLTMGGRQRQGDDQLPVEYPLAKRYNRWEIYNGRLVLIQTETDSTGATIVADRDTALFVRLRRDTLVLRFADEERKFYRKGEEEPEGEKKE